MCDFSFDYPFVFFHFLPFEAHKNPAETTICGIHLGNKKHALTAC